MFGALKTWGCGWNADERDEWVGHICGTCVALGSHCGQSARLTTNYDAALVLAFCEAQAAAPLPRTAHFCPLRGFSTADVVDPDAPAARYAAALSTLMAATKIEDHVADNDGWVGRLPTLAGVWAKGLKKASGVLADGIGFDTDSVEGPTAEQAAREAENGRGFLFYAQPTEQAAAAALAETAVIAGRPENRGVLEEIGALYGRLVYLLDSFKDLEDDRRARRFNPLQASYPEAEIPQRAVGFFTEAATKIRELLPRLELRRPEIIERLLVHELGKVGRRTLGVAMDIDVDPGSSDEPNSLSSNAAPGDPKKRKKDDNDAKLGCCDCLQFCDCCQCLDAVPKSCFSFRGCGNCKSCCNCKGCCHGKGSVCDTCCDGGDCCCPCDC